MDFLLRKLGKRYHSSLILPLMYRSSINKFKSCYFFMLSLILLLNRKSQVEMQEKELREARERNMLLKEEVKEFENLREKLRNDLMMRGITLPD